MSTEGATELFKHPHVLAAVRKAMKSGLGGEALLITNIEDIAPKRVRQAFEELVAAVADIARRDQ
jgi:hypothetical protein